MFIITHLFLFRSTPQKAMENQLVYQINRSDSEAIYFTLKEFKSKKYLDLRIYFQPKDLNEMQPTKKGLTVTADLVGELKKGILACEKEITALKMSHK